MEASAVPTLYEWMGGLVAIERLMTRFYARVPADPVLAPVFAHMDPAHAEHVSAFIAEVLGGPADYSRDHGGHAHMIRLAVLKSQPGAQAIEDAPMPKWGWGEVKGPYTQT